MPILRELRRCRLGSSEAKKEGKTHRIKASMTASTTTIYTMHRSRGKSRLFFSSFAFRTVTSQNMRKGAHHTDDEGWSERRKRLWSYFALGQDIFPSIQKWPWYAEQDVMTLEKKANARYNLFFFFVSNGLEPITAANWCTVYDVPPGQSEPVLKELTRREQDDYKGMIIKAHEGTMFKGTRRIIDINVKAPPRMV